MAPKVLILVGAPDSSSLDWNTSGLLDTFLEPVARFAGIYKSPQQTAANVADESTLDTAVWRSIPMERARLPTGFSQVHEFENEYRGNQDFFTTLTVSSRQTGESAEEDEASQSLLDEFYHHSLAVHHDIPSSQLPTATFSTEVSSFISTDSSVGESAADRSFPSEDRTLGLGGAHLSDLEDLPNAAYLKSISPQTMSVNLIVGVISIAEPRTVKTRWGATKSLVELLVGDETKAGFAITFWLSSDTCVERKTGTSLDEALKSLRRQDIILLRNVALSDFNKKVHGHSLRKGLTKIDLLYRRKLDDDDTGGFYSARDLAPKRQAHPQLSKTRKVRDWVLAFVGEDKVHLGKRKDKGKAVRSWEMPPVDTQ
jgi:hypothetical protein